MIGMGRRFFDYKIGTEPANTEVELKLSFPNNIVTVIHSIQALFAGGIEFADRILFA
jgi:hypothetical protein